MNTFHPHLLILVHFNDLRTPRVIKLQEKMKDILQLLTEIQVSQLRMAREQQRQGNIIRNVQKFLMDNRTNPINIEDSSQAMESEEEEPMEEPQEDQEEDQLYLNPKSL